MATSQRRRREALFDSYSMHVVAAQRSQQAAETIACNFCHREARAIIAYVFAMWLSLCSEMRQRRNCARRSMKAIDHGRLDLFNRLVLLSWRVCVVQRPSASSQRIAAPIEVSPSHGLQKRDDGTTQAMMRSSKSCGNIFDLRDCEPLEKELGKALGNSSVHRGGTPRSRSRPVSARREREPLADLTLSIGAACPNVAPDYLTDPKKLKGPERFFYDISSYTGCARYGGPSVDGKENGFLDLRAKPSLAANKLTTVCAPRR